MIGPQMLTGVLLLWVEAVCTFNAGTLFWQHILAAIHCSTARMRKESKVEIFGSEFLFQSDQIS